jgi:poly(hydroxyalkanoate) depolymerase family esterase
MEFYMRRSAWILRCLVDVPKLHCRVRKFVFPLLLALPMTAAAATWWCASFPWLCATPPARCGTPLTEVTRFGSNPGNLKMCRYMPSGLGTSRPLVVALHGCRQRAAAYDDEPGWIHFADKYGFALLLPQQQEANNANNCFNWFEPGDSARDRGEALSIRQMISKTMSDAQIDPRSVYVTGLSAGGAMAAVMLATYPEVFASGAIIAGVPYRCASGVLEALGQCGVSLSGRLATMKNLTPAEWGALVRNASSHRGSFPRVSIWHGTSDTTVNPQSQRELVDQWTNVHGIDQTSDAEDTINGHAHKLYKDAHGKVLVETFVINGMGHGTPINPGVADDQCGKVAPFTLSVGVCSSFHILKFWGVNSRH